MPLTPNQILTMKSDILLPPPGKFMKADTYLRKQWRRVQHYSNEFWYRWRREYLSSLQYRQKWNRPRRDLHVGDICILKDDNLPRGHWKLGRIHEVYPDSDGLVHKVKILMADPNLDAAGKRVNQLSYLERPIQKVVLLLESSDE